MDLRFLIHLFNPLRNNNILDLFKFKAFADDEINVTKILKFVLGRVKNIVGKRRKCWLLALSPFPTLFSKGFFPRVVKSRDGVVEFTLSHITNYGFVQIQSICRKQTQHEYGHT